ncbi:MAG: hypothetical protein Q9174_002876 [Haloplaca sp. 1 TL-2023]
MRLTQFLLFTLQSYIVSTRVLSKKASRLTGDSLSLGSPALAPTATVVVPLKQTEYHWVTTEAAIGGQPVVLLVDTGSSSFWVTASSTPGHSYDTNVSSTAHLLYNKTFHQSFPHASVSGIIVKDTVSVGSEYAIVRDFEFGFVDQKSAAIADQPFDGFIGLGFPQTHQEELSLASNPSLTEALLPRLPSPVFSAYLKNSGPNPPYLKFGGIDDAKYTGPLAKVFISRSTNRWTASNVGFSIGNQTMEETADLVFDTGGDNYISAPYSVIAEYYKDIAIQWGSMGSSNCTVILPCDSKLPDLEMHLGSGTAKVRGELMKGKTASGTGSSNPAISSSGLCFGVLQPFGDPPELLGNCQKLGLVGAPFFYEQYTVFNIDEPSLSYAPYA